MMSCRSPICWVPLWRLEVFPASTYLGQAARAESTVWREGLSNTCYACCTAKADWVLPENVPTHVVPVLRVRDACIAEELKGAGHVWAYDVVHSRGSASLSAEDASICLPAEWRFPRRFCLEATPGVPGRRAASVRGWQEVQWLGPNVGVVHGPAGPSNRHTASLSTWPTKGTSAPSADSAR